MIVYSENCCRFTGKLSSKKIFEAEDRSWILFRGALFLPDTQAEECGQIINIMAWGSVAERLNSLDMLSWITVLGCYSPSTFRGQLQDTFLVDSLLVRGCV